METNKIYCEDCLETMARMPDNFIDLIVTSPPYNMRTRIRNGEYTTSEKSEHFSKKYRHFDDAMPIDEFYLFHQKALCEMLRISKIICYNIQIVTGSKEAFFKIIGYFHKDIKDIIVWDKGHGEPAMHEQVLNSCYEMILIIEDDKKCGSMIQNAKFARGMMGNIIRAGTAKGVAPGHNAIFNDKIPITLIKEFSSEGDLVYDPFMGSGTTAKAAHLLKRNWIGSEISQEYVDIAEKRIKPYLDQKTLF